MKLATLTGGPDGTLIVVSANGTRYLKAADVSPTLQYALDQRVVSLGTGA